MIIHTETVEQVIDGSQRVTLVKEVIRSKGEHALGMVRKRLPPPFRPRGAVILIHGFAQNRYVWHASARSFSAYLAAEGWDVYNLELRGHGRSRRFGSTAPTAFAAYIREDVPRAARRALETSGTDRLFLIGHSMGGLIAYSVAATELRAETRGVVSIGSPYRPGVGSRALQAASLLLNAVRLTGVLDSNPVVPLRFIGAGLRRQRPLWDSRFAPLPIRAWSPGSVEDEVLDEYLARAFDRTSVDVAYGILRFGESAVLSPEGRTDYHLAFEGLDKPLLVIAGTHDHMAPPESVRPAYDVSRSHDKTYREFPFGHVDIVLGREAPVTVWPTVEKWLRKR